MNRIVLAGAAGIVAVGAVSASAASLGGVTSDQVGVDSGVVASCDTDGIDVDYTVAYSSDDTTYDVNDVTLSDVDATCAGQTYTVTLADDTGTNLATQTGAAVSGTTTVNFLADDVDGEQVTAIAVAIVGPQQ